MNIIYFTHQWFHLVLISSIFQFDFFKQKYSTILVLQNNVREFSRGCLHMQAFQFEITWMNKIIFGPIIFQCFILKKKRKKSNQVSQIKLFHKSQLPFKTTFKKMWKSVMWVLLISKHVERYFLQVICGREVGFLWQVTVTRIQQTLVLRYSHLN